mmetsp:Transcript_49541/g.95653  ORF Transcript_49541/g.95653 Transcript_49541/m.95653 type:complete len:112 (-) Transcript_49541:41-376(-)
MVWILRLALLLRTTCAFAAGDLNGGTRSTAMPVGKDHIMLQAAATMTKSEPANDLVSSADAKLSLRQETCQAISQGTCGAAPASLETKGTSRIQLKTKISKVVLDLTEEDD